MADMDEVTTLRWRIDALNRKIESKGKERLGRSRSGLFQVYDAGAIPSTVPKFYATHPVSIASSTESEGGTYTMSAGTAETPVLVLNQVPTIGDYLVARQIDGYWVSDHGTGSPSPGTPSCGSCTSLPLVITLTVAGFGCGAAGTATLTYGPTPTPFVPFYGAYSHLSTPFVPGLSYSGLLLTCVAPDSLWIYTVLCTTTTIVLNNPLYNWGTASPSNSCSPFSMIAGTPVGGGFGSFCTASTLT